MDKKKVQKKRPKTYDQVRTFKIEHAENNVDYPDNHIITTQYTAINFLPRSLFEQFRHFANIYFLVIGTFVTVAIIQSIPSISPLSPITAILPLVFVLAISMIRLGYEDHLRRMQDNIQNSMKTKVLRSRLYSQSGDNDKIDGKLRAYSELHNCIIINNMCMFAKLYINIDMQLYIHIFMC